MKTLIKWVLYNSVTFFAAAYLIHYYSAVNVLLSVDHTFITFIMLGMYALASIFLGYFAYRKDTASSDMDYYDDYATFWYVSELLIGLGLMATVIGNIQVFSALADPAMLGNLQLLLTKIGSGFSTIQYGTLVGFLSAFLLKSQLVFVFKDA
jgi:hypothetical protein